MVGVVVSSIVALSILINVTLSALFYFTIWEKIKKHRDLMKLCRYEHLSDEDLKRLIQLVDDKVVDINRRMRYDYSNLDLNRLGTGGAVTALELLFTFNKSNDLINCVTSFLNSQPALSLKNIRNAITVLQKFPDRINQEVILRKLENKRNSII